MNKADFSQLINVTRNDSIFEEFLFKIPGFKDSMFQRFPILKIPFPLL